MHVDPDTREANGEAELIAGALQWDDLSIDDRDEYGGSLMAYVTTFRDHSMVKAPLDLPDLAATKSETFVLIQSGEVSLDPCAQQQAYGRKRWGARARYSQLMVDAKTPAKDGMGRCAKVVRVEFWSLGDWRSSITSTDGLGLLSVLAMKKSIDKSDRYHDDYR